MRLPYTVGLVLTGIGLAVAGLETGAMLTHDFIFEVILPPLLFEAALTIAGAMHLRSRRPDPQPGAAALSFVAEACDPCRRFFFAAVSAFSVSVLQHPLVFLRGTCNFDSTPAQTRLRLRKSVADGHIVFEWGLTN